MSKVVIGAEYTQDKRPHLIVMLTRLVDFALLEEHLGQIKLALQPV